MSKTVDSRIVEMRFDNQKFEQNARTTMSTLDKLKAKLNFKGATEGLSEINQEAGRTNLNPLVNAVATVESKFSAMQVAAITALANITNSAVNAGKRIISALTIDPIKTGFQEYETQINAIQTILANTESKGSTLEDVNAALDELNTYADKTIYNFTEMTRNIGTFTAAGIDLDTSVSAIKGIANLAAVSGSTSQQASTAMYQLSQALSSGTVKLQDWNSVVNAGMGGQVFQDALKETARVHGIAIDQMIEDEGSFRNSLARGWITSEILTETLSKFTGDLNEEQLRTMGYSEEQIKSIVKMGQTANDAATKVKTFTQLFDTLKEAAQSGWTQSWEIIVGDFEEAKELLTNISDVVSGVIGKAAEARNNLLQGWKDLGGRKKLIESFWTIWNSVASVLGTVKEAFREIFPPMTSEKLYKLTKGFSELVDRLKPSEELLDKIKRTFKGLFAVVDILKTVFTSFISAVFPSFSSGAGTVIDKILGFTATIGDGIVKLRDCISESETFKKIFSGIGSVTGFISKAFTTLTNKLSDLASRFKSSGDDLEKSSFMNFLSSIWTLIKNVGSLVFKVLGNAITGLVESIKNANFDKITSFLQAIATGGIAAGIFSFVKGLKNVKDEIKNVKNSFGFFDSIKEILEGLSDTLESYQKKLKAEALVKIAIAIGILAASLSVLSFIDPKQLMNGVVAIGALFGELIGSMKLINKLPDGKKKIGSIAAIMIAMSSAVLILSFAMAKIGKLDWGGMARGLVGVGAMLTMLTLVVKNLSKNTGKMTKGLMGLVAMALAIRLLANSIAKLSELSWGQMIKGLVGVLALMGGIVGFVNISKSDKKIVALGLGMILIASGIRILASSCTIFSQMKWKEIVKGLVSIGGLLIGIMAFTKLSGSSKNLISMGIALIAIATGVRILASAMTVLGSLSWTFIEKGLASITGSLIAIALAMSYMPNDMISTGIGLVIVAGALNILANAMISLSGMSWENMAKSLVSLGGALAVIAIALNFMKNTVAGSTALILAAIAINILSTALNKMGSMSWTSIAKSLVLLAGAFVVIGVAAKFLGPLAPKILAISSAIALLGVGCLAAGVGIFALANGLNLLVTTIASGIESIISLRIAMAEVILTIINAGCDALIQSFPKIMQTIRVVLDGIINLLVEFVPKIAEAALQILTGVLKSLAEHIQEVTELAIDICVGFINGISEKLPDIIQAAVDLVISFIDGVAEAVGNEENIERLTNAVWNLAEAFIAAFCTFIRTSFTRIKNLGNELMESNFIQGIKDKVSGIWTAFKDGIKDTIEKIKGKWDDFKGAGKELINGLKDGITERFSKIWSSVKESCNGLVDKVKDVFGIHSPSKVFEQIGEYLDKGLAIGIEKFSGVVNRSGKNMCVDFQETVQEGFGDLSNITNGIDSTPTITPVLDLSKVEEGAKRISGIFSNRQAIYAAAEEATNREARATGTTINMTINASEGQDVRQLADIIAERINNSVRRTANAWK